jgi:hypothetical protein
LVDADDLLTGHPGAREARRYEVRRLLKLKWDGASVLVKYETLDGEDTGDTVTLESTDVPLPDFVASLQALAEHVVAICELPARWTQELRVTGVTLTYADDVRGVVITAQRKLQGHAAPLLLNSPHATNAEDAIKGTYSMACADALDAVQERALEYADGARAQLQLDLEPVAAARN